MKDASLESSISTLDPAQEIRIAAVHRGFLYQHLYAVGCLLQASAAGVTSLAVERDEDVEITLPTGRIYIQVKTRSGHIIPSDINSAVERFARLRTEHTEKRREGVPHFVIVVNQFLGPALTALIADGALGNDIQFIYPDQGSHSNFFDVLPPAWKNIEEAVRWCTAKAAMIPHAMLVPDSLVWKLAGLVQAAATGEVLQGRNIFSVEMLPDLFEQLLVQLQDFPTPPISYRPQIDEPDIYGFARIRMICGFSGAGKTSWASQAAMYSSETCVYFNAGDTPGTALASSLVRELAANLVKDATDIRRQIFLPGASGIDSLHTLDTYVGAQGLSPTVVIDNVHLVPAESICTVLKATTNLHFVLLCQPIGSTRDIEALVGVNREMLRGWSLDTLASEVVAMGARGSAETMGRLSQQTAGMPLFVQGAARLAVQDYDGDTAQLCDAIDSQTNIGETSQDVILSRTFDRLTDPTQDVVAVLSLADVNLKLEEVNSLLSASLALSAVSVASAIRTLRNLGVMEIFGGTQMKIHDAIRQLGRRQLELMPPTKSFLARSALKEILSKSLIEERDASRFSLYVRTLVALNEIETIIEFAGDEMFHEMGCGDVFLASLESAAASPDVEPAQRFWAYDGLVFAKLKSGDLTMMPECLSRMEELIIEHSLPRTTRLAFEMKRMLLKAQHFDLPGVRASIADIDRILPNSPQHQRIFKYNAAVALRQLEQMTEARRLVEDVISGYFNELGISEGWVFRKSQEQLHPLLHLSDTSMDDLKHLADGLELRSKLLKDQGKDPGLSRIFAMKFYSLVGAVDSVVRVGQDAADDHVATHDFIGARQIIEQHVLPHATHYRMLDRIVSIRSQYSVILAYCRDFLAARQEIQRLESYAAGFSSQQRQEIDNQRELIIELSAGNGPRQRRIVTSQSMPTVRQQVHIKTKIGRNDPCTCGSGLKYKKCHGYALPFLSTSE